METEGKIAMLDVSIQRDANGALSFDVYRKPTHTNQYIPFESHAPLSHKLATFRSLTQRASLIPSTEENKNKEELRIKKALAINGYPRWAYDLARHREKPTTTESTKTTTAATTTSTTEPIPTTATASTTTPHHLNQSQQHQPPHQTQLLPNTKAMFLCHITAAQQSPYLASCAGPAFQHKSEPVALFVKILSNPKTSSKATRKQE